MDTVVSLLLAEPAWVVYAVVGIVVLLEGALPAGILLPGEATALAGGASVALGRTDLVPMVLVVVAAAVVGDGLGFRMGRSTGPWLLRSRMLRSRRARLERLRDGMARRGPFSLVAARWTAFVRTMVPALAGASGMSYRRFVVWNGLGAVTWGATSVVLGALAGRSYAEVQGWLGGGGALLLGLALAGGALVALHRRRVAVAAARFGADAPVADVVLAA
ncbi:DedA family protein [Phycicoccus duodecadis]|uniref:Membrane protein DedA with SNARE-associated domain n=1 Tax=Phycicoccus duodecadis TaxID=173053 RepID=A0A2N3YLA3_9MICO|nr:VTT domain-containing protein [Phycicoccus duodecadis]PKW27633.1 membrane protein DedA with SNARE-associated domain [Phycicoccus duodecadis]